jgi:[acyl-carrier-protein] S-malonyltransferase
LTIGPPSPCNRYAQPALFVAGLAAVEALRKDNAAVVEGCSVTAGLSLGEYTALVFAGALSFEDGLKVRRPPCRHHAA